MRKPGEHISLSGWAAFNTSLIMALAVTMLAASVFTLPFPFVRTVWIGEIWGYYGLLNSVCFMLISQAIRRFSLAAVFAGLALSVYEQWLIWHAFILRFEAGRLDGNSLLYMGLSILVGGILLALLLSSARVVFLFCRRRPETRSGDGQKRQAAAIFILTTAIYLVLMIVAARAAHLEPKDAFAALRLLGVPACLLAGGRIGALLQGMLERRRVEISAVLRMIYHVLFFIWILREIHVDIPLAAIMAQF